MIHTLAEVPGSRALLQHNGTREDASELYEGGSLADVVAAASAASPRQVSDSSNHWPPFSLKQDICGSPGQPLKQGEIRQSMRVLRVSWLQSVQLLVSFAVICPCLVSPHVASHVVYSIALLGLQLQPGRWGSGRPLRPTEQQSAPRVNVYHGICAWAEGQLEGEPACPDRLPALAALL